MGFFVSRPLTFVRLDIARFGLELSEHRTDSELADWIRSLHRALVLGDPSLNDYAASMLLESDDFREKCGNASRTYWEGKRKAKGTNKVPNTRTEQNRTEQTHLPGAKAPRPRNELFDAIKEQFFPGQISKSDASRIGKMAATLKERGATPEQVAEKRSAYIRLHPEWELTPESVVKHWAQLVPKPTQTFEEKQKNYFTDPRSPHI